MIRLFCFLLLCINYKCFVFALFQGSLSFLSQLIEEELQPYQVTFFVNTTNVSAMSQYEFIFQKIIQKVPANSVNFGILKFKSNNKPLTLPVFKNAKHVSLHVIVYRNQNYTEDSIVNSLQNIIEVLKQLSPKHHLPKFLLILYGGKISLPVIEEILIYTWAMKFLDFSIIEPNTTPLVLYFNPFYQTLHNVSLYGETFFPTN